MWLRFIKARFVTAVIIAHAGLAAAAVDVASRASHGSGTSDDPWIGWDVNTAWNAENEYAFRAGTYAYFASPNFLKSGLALKGEPGTVLRFLGAGNAVVFDNPGTSALIYDNWTMNVRMENFTIEGTAAATNGIYVRAMRNGLFRNITVRDVSAAAFRCEACVTNILDGLHVVPHVVLPSHGIVLAARGGDTSTTLTAMNAEIAGVREAAVWVQPGSYGNTFMNAVIEGNAGKGFVFDGPLNTVIDTRMHANAGADIEINQSNNEVHGATSTGLVEVRAGQMSKLRGSFATVAIAFGCDFTDVAGANVAVLRDGASSTIKAGSQPVIGVPFAARRGRGP